jgi:hypothetical protein
VESDDDVYASYFRPEPTPPRPDTSEQPVAAPTSVEPPREEHAQEPLPEAEHEPADVSAAEPDVAAEPSPEPAAGTAVDAETGRLFRSQGVVGHEAAVLALASDHGGRLRTVGRVAAQAPSEPAAETPAEPRVTARRRTARASGSGISAGAVYIIVFGLTLVVGFINAWLASGTIGWPTGVALVAASVYCALRVRRDDDVVAMITPPLAFFVAAITAGQLLLGAQAGSLLNRAQKVFFTLADNWYWVIGATLAAVIIVLVRRRRG